MTNLNLNECKFGDVLMTKDGRLSIFLYKQKYSESYFLLVEEGDDCYTDNYSKHGGQYESQYDWYKGVRDIVEELGNIKELKYNKFNKTIGDKTMEREVIKVYFPYLKALAEDKDVQCDISGEWKDIDEISFSIGVEHYRIKPKSKYRPFKNQEECWEEMHKHPDFGWIKGNVTGEYKQVVRVYGDKTELFFNISYNSPADYCPEMMFDSYTFADGTPFGIKEE